MSKKEREYASVLLEDEPAAVRKRVQHTVGLCESLFVQTKHVHGLTKTSLKLLRVAAVIRQGTAQPKLLREARRFLTLGQCRIVRQAVEMVASQAIGGARKGQIPEGKDATMAGVAFRIAAILRIAEGLESLGCQDTRIIGIRDDGRAIDVCVADSPSAKKNAIAAMRKADWWNRVALRPIRSVVVAAADRSAGRLPTGSDASMAEAGRLIFQRQIEQLISRQYGLAYDEDLEYVHEMRVAIRRLRAAIRVFRKGFAGELESECKQLRTLSDALGAARDADVFVEFLTGYMKTCPRRAQPLLTGLIAFEKRQRGRHYGQLLEAFRARGQRTFLRRVYERFQRPIGSEGGLVPSRRKQPEQTASRARKMLRRRLQAVTAYGRRLDLLSSAEQHQLRIACKKLRYTAEFFTGVYSSRLQGLVGVMTRMQDLLGMSHDTDVYFGRLAEYSRKRYGEEPRAPVVAALRTTRARLRRIRKQCLRQAIAVWKSFTDSQTQESWKKLIATPRPH